MRTVIPILIIVLSFSCSVKNSESDIHESTVDTNTSTSFQLSGSSKLNQFANQNARLIKKADYYFKVNDVRKSSEAIEQTLVKYPAFISSSNLELANGKIQNEITIRVQSEYFNELLKEIDKMALYVHYRNVSTADVSKEFVDLESRLKTKREVESRYTEILRKKAGTIEELLEAEKQIGALHEEIEATISRINFLKDQVGYSTINLKFYQETDHQLSEQETLAAQFANAFTSGFNGLVVIGLVLTNLWPLLFLIIIFLLIWRFKSKTILKPEKI